VPIGQDINQNPAPNSEVDEGTAVTITVSSGTKAYTVPNVVGKTEQDAVDTLRNDDGAFKVSTQHQSSDTVDEGKVISSDPPANTEVSKGATVTIVVSSGPEMVTVPNVVGKTETAAKNMLVAAGFKVDSVTEVTPLDNTDDGIVTDQDPNGNTKAKKGSTVTITVGG
jgi:serine/threonine-protein kinase